MYYLTYELLKRIAEESTSAAPVKTGPSDPNNVVIGDAPGQLYAQVVDNKISSFWLFQGAPGSKGPWITVE